MPASNLTNTTVRYLFASTWAPRDDSGWTMPVPGAQVDGLDTAGNLLNLAVWSLREQELVEVQQLRPVETERVTVYGGRSFARLRALDEHAQLPGLEGALLAKAREKPEEGVLGRLGEALDKKLSGDDEDGLRGHVLALDLHDRAPWATVAGYCVGEARAAGLVEVKGRIFKKPVITDPAAVEKLKARDAEIVAARTKYRERETELDNAVISDCLHAVSWAYQSSPD